MSDFPEYAELTGLLRELHYLKAVHGLLEWDEQVLLPSGSASFRARQSAAMASVVHEAETTPRIGELLKALEPRVEADQPEGVVVREARKDYDRKVRLPAEFVRRKSEAQSAGYHAWTKAREANEYPAFAPHLKKLVDLAKEEAGYLGVEPADAYDYWIDRFDPGMCQRIIDPLFEELKRELPGLVDEVMKTVPQADTAIFRNFPVDGQELFLREVIERIGFDFNRGRIDRSIHPFCSGSGSDIRMTTRFDVDNPLDSLTSAVHETGHALYEQGLPEEHAGTALGEAVGMAVHESQSRIWENQIARSRGFWECFEPRYREIFPEQLAGVDSETFYAALNAVRRIPIRVDSDEVTYNQHIILRYELEKRLFADTDAAVRNLPEIWREQAQLLLGLSPAHDAEGCLQDVHWSGGAFGYFPSYTLGNLLAAQLWESLQQALPDCEAQFARGEFSPVLTWLRENIHSHGRRWDTQELARKVTGSGLQTAPLLRYLRGRYLG